MIQVDIPILTKSPGNGSHGSWVVVAKRRKEHRAAVRWALMPHKPMPLPVVVTFVRVSPRPLDDDNLAASFKSMRDEVAVWLGVDDGPRETRVTWRYEQEHSRKCGTFPALKGTRIRVEAKS